MKQYTVVLGIELLFRRPDKQTCRSWIVASSGPSVDWIVEVKVNRSDKRRAQI